MTSPELERKIIQAETTLNMYRGLEHDPELCQHIQFVDANTIYMEDDVDILKLRRVFRCMFGVNERVDRYYMSGCRLSIMYMYGSFRVIFFTRDVDWWLARLSGGTCRVETKSVQRSESYIMCDVGGGQ